MNNIWKQKTYDRDALEHFEDKYSSIFSKICASRKFITYNQIDNFLKMSLDKLHDPFLLPNIEPAIERLVKAIEGKEKIFVWGDYDVDGITATAVVITVLNMLDANFEYHVPHRQIDGYDIKEESIEKVVEAKADLLITVDCGILAFEAAKKAKELKLDLIITDHHTPSSDGRIPQCIAVINPKLPGEYPFEGLAGVGIAFKFMIALASRMNYPIKKIIHKTLDLVALGTVADVAPMIDENRIMVSYGCKFLNSTKKPGIKSLLKISRATNIDSTNIGFTLGPRINAVGRLADPRTALDLLISDDEAQSSILAQELEQTNLQRQKIQEKAYQESLELVKQFDTAKDGCIVMSSKTWPPGVVGLIAGKLAEKFNVPTLIAHTKEDGYAKGSCRSAKEINILECLKNESCLHLFKQKKDGSYIVGGHAFAAGFEIHEDNVDKLRSELSKYINTTYQELQSDNKTIFYDCDMLPSDINYKTITDIKQMAPFGAENPIPILMLKNLTIESVATTADERHLKFTFSQNSTKTSKTKINAMWWQNGPKLIDFENIKNVNILFYFDFSSLNEKYITIYLTDVTEAGIK